MTLDGKPALLSKTNNYIVHWSGLHSDLTKIHYLLMLKERAQVQQDKEAKDALFRLTERWLTEPFEAS